MAFVEDEDDAFVAQRGQHFLVGGLVVLLALFVALACFIQRQAELLNGGDDDLVGVVLGEQAAHQRSGVGVFLDAAFLELIEFLAGLAIEILAIHHEDALVNVVVFLEQGGGLEGGECLAAAGGAPDETIARVSLDALHDVFHLINLIRPHDHELLLACKQHHVAADGAAEVALLQKAIGEVIKMSYFLIVLACKLIDGQKALFGIEGEVAAVVVSEVVGAVAIANDIKLHKAEQRLGVTIAGVALVFDDLLHGSSWIDAEAFELNLHHRHTVDQQDDVKAMVTVVRVDAELVDDLEDVFAPILEVHQRIIERCAVIASEGIDASKDFGGSEHIWRDDLVEQASKFAIGQLDTV